MIACLTNDQINAIAGSAFGIAAVIAVAWIIVTYIKHS